MENVFGHATGEILGANEEMIDFSSVVNNLSEVVWSIDLTVEPYQFRYLNDPVSRVPNGSYQKAPTTIDEWQAQIHEEDRERILDEYVNVLNNGYGSYAYRVERGPGNYRYVRDRVKVLYEDEKPLRIDGITIDIDDIRKSRLNLELSQQRLKSIVDSLPDPVFISTRKDGKAIFANEVFFEVYGMNPGEFLGKKVVQFYQNFDTRKTYLSLLAREGRVQNHELVLKNKKDESFWVSASTMPLDFQNEACYITILQDITFRKTLEQDLKDSNERYQLAVEGTNDVIWEYDFNRGTSYLSPQFWAALGLEQETNPLDDNLLSRYLHEEDRKAFISTIQNRFKRHEEDLETECRFIGEGGKVIWVFIKARILYDKKGDPARVVGSLSNITSLKQARSKLQESEAKYRIISQNSSDCICLHSPERDFVFVSASSFDVIGYKPDELERLRLRDIIDGEYYESVKACISEVILNPKKKIVISFKAKQANGELVWLETHGGAILDQEGQIMYFQTSTRNITARVQAEDKLRESEERYKLISQNSHDIVSLMDLEGKYLFISPSIKDTLGYEVEEMLGRATTDFIHPDDLPGVIESMQDTLAQNTKMSQALFRFRHKNGDYRWLEAKGGIINDEEGQPRYFRSTKVDMTDKIRAEQKLKEKEEQYKLVSENSTDVIALHDLDGKFSFISPSCFRLIGYTEEESLGKDPLGLIHKEDVERVRQVFADTIANKSQDVQTSYRIRKRDGDYVPVGVSLTPVLDDKGKVQYVLSSTRDITEIMKVIEKERYLNKLKSSFISMASHEFRTPLTTIQSSNELIQMYLENQIDPTNGKLTKHVSRIRVELERLNSLLKDVFTLGRLDVGRARVNKELTSLTAIAKQVILETSVAFKNRGVSVATVGDERQVNLDSQLISHAMSNIVLNALKYSEGCPDPEMTITYGADFIDVEVKDFGIGIPDKDKEGLFESFSRASNVGDIEGTGLGLVIVRQFVEMHDGTISFESELKKGSTFKIHLPNI